MKNNIKHSKKPANKTVPILKFLTSDRNEILRKENLEPYCAKITSCDECIKNSAYCDWHFDYGCSRIDLNVLVSKTLTTMKFHCPFVTHEGHVAIHAGVSTNVDVKVYAPFPEMFEREISCEIQVSDSVTLLQGVIINDMVHCYEFQYDLDSENPVEYGSFKLNWGGIDPYSNEVPLVVYNCETMAKDCESCSQIGPEYGCGWCDVLSQCVMEKKCPTHGNWWLSRNSCHHVSKELQ